MNIRQWRIERGMTQEELAKRLDVTKACVSQWEVGWTRPNLDRAYRLIKMSRGRLTLESIMRGHRKNNK